MRDVRVHSGVAVGVGVADLANAAVVTRLVGVRARARARAGAKAGA